MTNIDSAIHRVWALSLGQRSAISRMAHLFCELHARLDLIGRTKGDTYELPLTQRELAERRRGLVEFENRRLKILDRRGLEGVAEFDPTYLYLERHSL